MKNEKILAAVVLASVAASAGTMYRWYPNEQGDGVHWSDVNNWVIQNGNNIAPASTPPVSNENDTVIYFYADKGAGTEPTTSYDTVNDIPGLFLRKVQLGGYINEFRLSGETLHTGAIEDCCSTDVPGRSFVFDCDVRACLQGAGNTVKSNPVTIQPANQFVFNGLVTHEYDEREVNVGIKANGTFDKASGATGIFFTFKGGGTNVFNGAFRVLGINQNNLYGEGKDYFTGGTAIFNGDCDFAWIQPNGGARVIIGPNATVRKMRHGGVPNWFQKCDLDVYGRYLGFYEILGQGAGPANINVYDGGYFNVWGEGSTFRTGNNHPNNFNVYGGMFVWGTTGQALGEASIVTVNLKGGVLAAGSESGSSAFSVSHTGPVKDGCPGGYNSGCGAAGTDAEKRCTVNLDGGELRCKNIYDGTTAGGILNRNRDLFFNGGRLHLTGTGAATQYSSSFDTEEKKATLKHYLKAGGLVVENDVNVNWPRPLEVRTGDTPGPFIKLGAGFFRVAADMNACTEAVITGGTFRVDGSANWTKPVTILAGTKLDFTETPLTLDGLTSENGTVVLAAGQSLALKSAPVVPAGKGLVFDVATATDGVYTLVTCDEAMDEGLPAKCAVTTPTAAKSAVFSLDNDGKSLVLTVADGTAPQAAADLYDLTPWSESKTVLTASTNFSTLTGDERIALSANNARVVYTGSEAGTLRNLEVGASDVSVKRSPGAGPLDVYGPLATPANATAPGRMIFEGQNDGNDLTLHGDFLFGGSQILRLWCGNILLADDCFINSRSGSAEFWAANNYQAHFEIDEGAVVNLRSLSVGPAENTTWSNTNDTFEVVQRGKVNISGTGTADSVYDASLKTTVGGSCSFGRASAMSKLTWTVDGGDFFMYPHSKFSMYKGRHELVITNGGKAVLPRLYAGNLSDPTENTIMGSSYGAQSKITVVDGGELVVPERLSWISTSDPGKRMEIAVNGGKVTLPATQRQYARTMPRMKKGDASLILEGDAALTLGGESYLGGTSTDNYFDGLDTFHLGAGGATIVNTGDAVISNRVLAAASGAGTLVKKGAGTLELAGENNVLAGIDVKAGTLAAAVPQTETGALPSGLVAYWDFNGEGDEPLKDKSGNGLDLEQVRNKANSEDVLFKTNELTHAGRGNAACWNGKYESLKCTSLTNGCAFKDFTISLWVYLDNVSTLYSWNMWFSNRIDPAFSNTGGGYEIGYKGNNIKSPADGNYHSGVTFTEPNNLTADLIGDFSLKTWHMVTFTSCSKGTTTYFDGVRVYNRTSDTGQTLLPSGRIFTIGQGIATSEFANKGCMLDDIMVFCRALSDEEIAGIYAEQSSGASIVVKPVVKVAEGAVWDMLGAATTAPTVEGAGAITNGTLEIEAAIRKTSADTNVVLHIANPVINCTTGVVDFAVDPLETVKSRERMPLFTFDDMSAESKAAIVKWSATGTGSNAKNRRFVLEVAESAVNGYFEPAGVVLLFR